MKSFAKLAAIVGVSLFMGAAAAQDTGTTGTDTGTGATDSSAFGTGGATSGGDTTGGTAAGGTTGGTGSPDMMQDPQDTETARTPTADEQRHPRAGMDENSTATTGASQAGVGQTQIRDVQSALSSRGYDVQVDGIMGGNTQDALRRFQRDEGLEETGQLDQATLQALNIEATGDRAPASVPSEGATGTESGMDTGTGLGTDTGTGTGTGM